MDSRVFWITVFNTASELTFMVNYGDGNIWNRDMGRSCGKMVIWLRK